MIRGLYTSALGMITQMNKMDIVSNNIANADTIGYKRDLVVTRSFSEELMKRLHDPSDISHDADVGKVDLGVFIDDLKTDFRNGSYKLTQGDLDIAIMGDGFFAFSVLDANGNVTEKYGKNGSFKLGSNGTLFTKEGHHVLGENGSITIPSGIVNIDAQGNIFSGNELVDKLKIVKATDTTTLRKFGDNLYDTTDETKFEPFNGRVEQGYLETSNVNSVKEMIEMITVARTYEANQRMIAIQDGTIGKAVNEIGRK